MRNRQLTAFSIGSATHFPAPATSDPNLRSVEDRSATVRMTERPMARAAIPHRAATGEFGGGALRFLARSLTRDLPPAGIGVNPVNPAISIARLP